MEEALFESCVNILVDEFHKKNPGFHPVRTMCFRLPVAFLNNDFYISTLLVFH